MAILGFAVVAVTQVAYEVEGWGVGELVVADDRVVWHELPWPRAERPALDVTDASPGPIPNPHPPGAGAWLGRITRRRQAEIEAS